MKEEFQVWPSSKDGVYLHDGKPLSLPAGWVLVPSGDPGLTRRLKTLGDYWVLVHKRRNRIEAIGLLTDEKLANVVRKRLDAERATPAYRQKLEAGRKAREHKQDLYTVEFRKKVLAFLGFAPKYSELAEKLAESVTAHAVPVGSGTVARTETIPVEQRAEAAVIAWMRHRTTAYDHMTIARVKGERREVRRRLAVRSRELLAKYRSGEAVDPAECPLQAALR